MEDTEMTPAKPKPKVSRKRKTETAKAGPNVLKKKAEGTLHYFLLFGEKTILACAESESALKEIKEDYERVESIDPNQPFCYAVSFGAIENRPSQDINTKKSVKGNVYIVKGFDLLPIQSGRAVVVASSQSEAIKLVDDYLRPLKLQTYKDKTYEVLPVPPVVKYYVL